VECGGDPRRDRDPPAAEDPGGERGEKRRAERADGRGRELRPRDLIRPPEGGDREESGIAGRAEEEDVGAGGVAPFPGDRLRGAKVRAGVPEPDRREAGDRDDSEPGRQREDEDREEDLDADARDRRAES